ncbi:MAG: NADH-quinone oxidoreductase subunit [Acidobacteriota bacterium]|jgi:NADH-quinone oxidoreductase subunit C|nr:NADH-quinone oxidoreductase subunit [Acidobacteriota bacterium]MDT7779323.1 NADH-quinone oxidoreductase subunit [Acidobacteriota bacterium]
MSQDIEREKEIAAGSRAANSYPLPPVELVSALRRENDAWVTEVIQAFGEMTLVVPREHIAALCAHLKTAPGFEFDMLSDVSGVDRGPEEEPRFEVNYHLFSTKRYHRLRLKVLLNQEDTHVETVTGVWRTANWHERETFDMFGVVFDGHPDLRRILLPDDWQGHALRKDFPLRGYEPYSLT